MKEKADRVVEQAYYAAGSEIMKKLLNAFLQ